MPDDAPTPPPELPEALRARLSADPRVIGAAWTDAPSPALLVATTWDGRDALAAELPSLGAHLVSEPRIERTEPFAWEAIGADGSRFGVRVVRIADLRPSALGESAVPVIDARGLMEQWVRWSRGRPDAVRAAPPADETAAPADGAFAADAALRVLHAARSNAQTPRELRHLRRSVRGVLAKHAKDLGGGPAADALRARVAAATAAPLDFLPGEGVRTTGGADPAAALEAFLAAADAEGFKGDRVLFDAARARLAELSRRAPEFDEGFVVPTFDAVETRWRFGEGIGGCRQPLVPCVHVGVGVTPKDELEFWAAPAVRAPQCGVACAADPGARTVVARTAGRDAFLSALYAAVDAAWEELPDMLRAARRAGRSSADDPAATMRPLHLPRSFTDAAMDELGEARPRTRLHVALALARAGDGEAPLVARKLGLAAGRLLRETPQGASSAGCAGGAATPA